MPIVAAVHEGYVLQKSVVRAPNAGALLNKCMLASVKAKGGSIVPSYTFKRVETPSGQTEIVHLDQPNTTASFRDYHVDQIVADLKESVCRVNEGYFDPKENTNIPMVSYELPDGNEIQVGVDRFAIPEIMFQPKLLENYPGAGVVTSYDGGELPSITGMILESVNRCDVDIRRDLLSGIVLTGGTSLFGQLRDRLERELMEVAPQTAKVKITTPANPAERRFGVWIGGSILASLGTFQQMWMSKAEFEEHGPSLVHRKAP